VFAIFNLNWLELIILAGLGLVVLLIVLAVIFLASRGSPQDRRRDED
jgi:hypothetical protein